MIDVEIVDRVAVITLDCPPVNAFQAEDYRDATATIAECDEEGAVRAMVLIGAGERAFCAGTDTAALATADSVADVTREALAFFTALSNRSTPLVGALNGPAIGGGAMIAAECDVLVATRATYFRIPELRLGFPGAASHLKRLFPYNVVQRMLLCDERVTAERAWELGAVGHVVDDRPAALGAALAHARRIAELDPSVASSARGIFRQPEAGAALAGYRAELNQLVEVLRDARRAAAG